jgi:DNA-binding MarR family transcriptional regulator
VSPDSSSPSPARTLDELIGVAVHVESELSEALRENHLSRPSYQALQALDAAPDGTLTQSELAARVRRAAGTLSVRLGRLERAGMVTREADPDDRRATRVQITQEGRDLLAAARPGYEQRASRLAEALPEGALAELDDRLSAWREFFEPPADGAPRRGGMIAPASIANRMRRAVGLPDVPGILVLRVAPTSAAAAAGLSRGDLITAAGGAEVRTTADLERALGRANGELTLSGVRGAEPIELNVTLAG